MIWVRFEIVVIFLGLCGAVFAQKYEGDLRAVIVLFRHGDRSPKKSWPNDEYYSDPGLWPDGYAQLNNFGKERHYRLGQWFRNRYEGFLPQRYNRSGVYVRSSDVDRTLMSAAAHLAGLFPPVGDQVWDPSIQWQPIPIHTVPIESDAILKDDFPCPKHDSLTDDLLSSEEFTQLAEQNSELYKNISDVTGWKKKKIDLKKFNTLQSTITIYREFNLTLPDWTTYYWPEIDQLSFLYKLLPTYTKKLARLRVGPFYDYLLTHLKAINDSTFNEVEEPPPFYLILSAHETQLVDFTNSMGINLGTTPEFAASLTWEVKFNTDKTDLFLNLYYKNSTGLIPLIVPGCDFDCSLDDYNDIMSDIALTMNDFVKKCNK